jgi:hypothetical protein
MLLQVLKWFEFTTDEDWAGADYNKHAEALADALLDCMGGALHSYIIASVQVNIILPTL